MVEVTVEFWLKIPFEISDAGTAYNFDTIDV
jgi:hypothetical protein